LDAQAVAEGMINQSRWQSPLTWPGLARGLFLSESFR